MLIGLVLGLVSGFEHYTRLALSSKYRDCQKESLRKYHYIRIAARTAGAKNPRQIYFQDPDYQPLRIRLSTWILGMSKEINSLESGT